MVVKRVGSKNVDLTRSVLLEMKQVNYAGVECSETSFRTRRFEFEPLCRTIHCHNNSL